MKELGFVGCNLNPDPSGGHWQDPPLTDRWWYPLYEKLVELDVPAMVHVSASCNPCFHAVGAHYINGDTTAFMQFLASDLFRDFPTLRVIIPHGGGAVPYHWGRYRGLAQDMGRPPLEELLLKNVYFDTCVYHQPGIDLLLKVIPVENILFASEMVGAVRGIDPRDGLLLTTTRSATSTRRPGLTAADRQQDLRRQRPAGLQPPEAARLSEPQTARRISDMVSSIRIDDPRRGRVRGRDPGDRRRARRDGPGLSLEDREDPRRLRPRRRDGHRGAHGGPEDGRRPRADGDHREQAGRGQQHRHPAADRQPARRLHGDARRQRPHGEPAPLHAAAVRSQHGRRAHLARRAPAGGDRRRREVGALHAPEGHRCVEGAPRERELRVARAAAPRRTSRRSSSRAGPASSSRTSRTRAASPRSPTSSAASSRSSP